MVAAVSLCLLNLYLLVQTGDIGYRKGAPNRRGKAFVRVTDAMNFIDQERQGHKLTFWYNEDDPNDYEFESINSIYLWGYTWMSRQFPALDEAGRGRAAPGSMIVVLTTNRSDSSVLADANQALQNWRLAVTAHAAKEVQGSGAHYRVIPLDLHRAPSEKTAEVVVNLALEKPAAQSSFLIGAEAANAVDGNTDGHFSHGSVTHTELQNSPWWQVDLGSSTRIRSIVIWNRTDAVSGRLADYWVFVSDTPFLASDTPSTLQRRPGTWSSHQTDYPNPSTTISTNGVHGRYVRIQLGGTNYLSLAEVQVF